MHAFICVFFVSLHLISYLSDIKIIPRQTTWFIDLFSLVSLIACVFFFAKRKHLSANIYYAPIIILLILLVICGIALNSPPPGAVFGGIRNYLKFAPLFILPLVYSFNKKQIQQLLGLLLILAVIQSPLALYQRFFQYNNLLTGDVITGTLNNSGDLSLLLLAAISIVTSFYISGYMSKLKYMVILFLLFVPTTINATKVTLFLLPVALFSPIIFSDNIAQLKSLATRLLPISIIFIALTAVYMQVYDHFMLMRRPESLIDFLSTEDRLNQYLENTGRSQAIILPFKYLSDDPTQILLGLGIGNVSISFLGHSYSGEYYETYGNFIRTTLALWQWELGLIGAILSIIFLIRIFVDCKSLIRHASGLERALAQGFTGVIIVTLVSLLYNKALVTDITGYTFWYLAGIIVSLASKQCKLAPLTTGKN